MFSTSVFFVCNQFSYSLQDNRLPKKRKRGLIIIFNLFATGGSEESKFNHCKLHCVRLWFKITLCKNIFPQLPFKNLQDASFALQFVKPLTSVQKQVKQNIQHGRNIHNPMNKNTLSGLNVNETIVREISYNWFGSPSRNP